MHSNKKKTTEEFVREARLVHGDKFDYSKTVYKKRTEKVCIICPVHGEFWQVPADHLKGCGCAKCANRVLYNTEEFIAKAIVVHGDNYDYSKTVYVKSKEKVCIICKECGTEFYISPNEHLGGRGCPKCGIRHRNDNRRGFSREDIKKRPYGVGINDYKLSTTNLVSYKRWMNMLQRCYNKDYQKNKPTYVGCTICEEWKVFSNFKKWFDENYVEGYALDKDILVKGNKLYSPESCCFVPMGLNSLLTKRDNNRGYYPIGVSKTKRGKFIATLHKNGDKLIIGRYETPEEAFNAYKEAKEKHIQEVAIEYYSQGKITERVYNALMNYKVEITD